MLFLNIPKEINININEKENWIKIEGPLGKVCKKLSKNLKLNYNINTRELSLNHILNKELNHFYLATLNRIIIGLLQGYSKKLNIIGVGYKAFLEKNKLILKIGYSHNIEYNIPQNIKIKISTIKGLSLIVFGNDLQKVSEVASQIRSLKSVEPYKGKGIKYSNEIVKRKEGKKSNV